jgi:hypothetical protein
MRKSEVYSWRLSPATKAALEAEARRAGSTVAALLDRIAHDWLRSRRGRTAADATEQARRHAVVAKALGQIAGGDPRRAERAHTRIRERLSRRRAR